MNLDLALGILILVIIVLLLIWFFYRALWGSGLDDPRDRR